MNVRFRSLVYLLSFSLGLLSLSPYTFGAAKPIAGIACGGGFYVRTPDKHIHWILRNEDKKTEVYDQSYPLYAMAECDGGVLSVFNTGGIGKNYFKAYFSPDCLNIGNDNGSTRLIYSGPQAVVKIANEEDGVKIKLSDDTYLQSQSCEALGDL